MREAITLALTMLGGGMAAILLLMLVAKLTAKVNVEEKQGRKPVYNIQAEVKAKRTLVEADPAKSEHPENPLLCDLPQAGRQPGGNGSPRRGLRPGR